MAVPAEFYDSDESMDFEDFSCGDEYIQKRPPPRVDNGFVVAARLRTEREETIIEIIRSGQLAELVEMHRNPPGFDLDARLLNDWPPLLHAAFEAKLDKMQWLLANGAHCNQSVEGKTALIVACMASDQDEDVVFGAVNVLLNNGAVLNTGDRVGRTPLMYAVRNGYERVVRLFLADASLEACDNEGNTALFHAIENKRTAIVRMLLKANARTDVLNANGLSVRQWAEDCGLEDIEELFPEIVDYVVPPEYLESNTPAALAPTVFGNGLVPPFFYDVREMLIGMRSGQLVQNFAVARIGLFDFLRISDAQMESIGVVYPFQRNRVRFMLQQFHEHEFSPRALRPLDAGATTVDLFSVVAGHLKHLLIVRSSIEYLLETRLASDEVPDVADVLEMLGQIGEKVGRLRKIVFEIDSQADPPVQHISPKPEVVRRRVRKGSTPRRWCKRIVFVSAIIVSAITVRKCFS